MSDNEAHFLSPSERAWFEQVPNVHRWLRGDDTQPFVITHDGHDYWLAAYYVMRAILGWSDAGLGLQRLRHHTARNHVSDVLTRGWDGRLDAIAFWLWTVGEMEHGDPAGRLPADFDRADAHWPRRAEALALAYGFLGGHDAHHLRPHLRVALDALNKAVRPPPAESIVTHDRRVVLFVDRLDDWPTALGGLGHSLHGAEPPSWRVDVVDRSSGHLGQFRRCWGCRHWFQGTAEVHKLGHAHAR